MASILLVDDDEFIRAFVHDALRQAGHSVHLAENGMEGLAALEKALVDLVLVDLVMPVMNGIEMIRDMRKRGLSHKVIAMSGGGGGAGDGPTLAGAVAAGADHALPKPFRLGDLLETVSRHLPHAKP